MPELENPPALPPGWGAIAFAIDNGWDGDFTDDMALAYYGFLRVFDARVVMNAVQALGVSGRKFYPRPRPGHIAAECHRILGTEGEPSEFDAPPWSEVYVVCEEAAHRNRRNKTAAVEAVGRRLGPVAAAWFHHHGYSEFLSPGAAFGDPKYGAKNRADLGETYDEFVESGRGRARKGLTQTTVEHHGGLRAVAPLNALSSPGAA